MENWTRPPLRLLNNRQRSAIDTYEYAAERPKSKVPSTVPPATESARLAYSARRLTNDLSLRTETLHNLGMCRAIRRKLSR